MPRPILDERLIGRIYDGVEDTAAWAEVASTLVDAIGGERGSISAAQIAAPGPADFMALSRTDPDDMQRVMDNDHSNPWIRTIPPQQLLMPVASDRFVSFDTLKATAFYREIFEPLQCSHGVLALLAGDGVNHMAALTVSRSHAKGAFSEAEIRLLHPVMPHLKRANQLRLRLLDQERQKLAAFASLQHLAQGVVLLDRDGRVMFANQAMLRMASAGDGVILRANRILASTAGGSARLEAIIHSALNGGGGGEGAIQRPTGRLPLSVLASPLGGSLAERLSATGAPLASVVLFITDPETQASPPAELLRELYGLTPTEARVALRIAADEPVPQAAITLGIGVATVRTHLKRIFHKTGVSSQIALVRLVLSAAPACNGQPG